MDQDLYPPLASNSRTQQVTEVLMQLITSNSLVPGDFLPSEAELCQRLGVSRPTLRQALRSLEVRGLVVTKRGVGVQVTDRTGEVATDSIHLMLLRGVAAQNDLLEVRWALESQAARLAARRATTEDIQSLNEYIHVMCNSSSLFEDYIEADLNFHLRLARASKNAVLVSLTQAISKLLRDAIRATYSVDGHTERRLQHHKQILNAIAAGDPVTAEMAIQKHLRRTEKNLKQLGMLQPTDKNKE